MTEGPASNVVSLAARNNPDQSDIDGCKEALTLAGAESYTALVVAGWTEGGDFFWSHYGDLSDLNLILDQAKAEVLAEASDD